MLVSSQQLLEAWWRSVLRHLPGAGTELEVIAKSRRGEAEGERPPDAYGSHAEGESEHVGQGYAYQAIGDECIEHHGSNVGDGPQGIGIDGLQAIAYLISHETGKEGEEEEGDVVAGGEDGGDEGTA